MSPEPVGDLPALLGCGTVVGALWARWLRRIGLRFEWPLLALPLAAGLALVDHESATLVGWAVLVAMGSGVRSQWPELEVGGDVALWPGNGSASPPPPGAIWPGGSSGAVTFSGRTGY